MAPVTKTRIDVEPGHVLVDIALLGEAPVLLDDERAAQLRARLADAVEDVLERFWPENA